VYVISEEARKIFVYKDLIVQIDNYPGAHELVFDCAEIRSEMQKEAGTWRRAYDPDGECEDGSEPEHSKSDSDDYQSMSE